MNTLNEAIVAYRENPTPENKARLLALQTASTQRFYSQNASEYIRRTRS